MAKIGRNEPCPCRSGLKYKRCCLHRQKEENSVSFAQQLKISLMAEIEKIQQAARQHKETVRELGVFIFCATAEGDAWLLEITENDAVQLAGEGEPLPVALEENPETIEINWSHTFAIRDRRFFLTSYADEQESYLEKMPARRIQAAMKRIRKKYSADQLQQVHIDAPAREETG
ncbi:MAG: SEC-C metal-binding domain-containing protein [Desulfobulbaceae bacterium]|nr:SEC-C metal-binding domain-containing protein [Desulfobulbaceae bacterium]